MKKEFKGVTDDCLLFYMMKTVEISITFLLQKHIRVIMMILDVFILIEWVYEFLLFVSPLIKPNTVLRTANVYGFEHSSLISSLNERWPFPLNSGVLTSRAKIAPTFWNILAQGHHTDHSTPLERLQHVYDTMSDLYAKLDKKKTIIYEQPAEKKHGGLLHFAGHLLKEAVHVVEHPFSSAEHEGEKLLSDILPFSTLAHGILTYGTLVESMQADEFNDMQGLDEDEFMNRLNNVAARKTSQLTPQHHHSFFHHHSTNQPEEVSEDDRLLHINKLMNSFKNTNAHTIQGHIQSLK